MSHPVPPVVRPLSAESLYNAAKARNNSRSPRGRKGAFPKGSSPITTTPRNGSAGRVSATTNAPLDRHGERSVIDGRYVARRVFLRMDSDSRRGYIRYLDRHAKGLSVQVIECQGDATSVVDVCGIDGKWTGDGERVGNVVDAFLSQPFVMRWEYRTTARPPMVGSGACASDTLSPVKAREVRQSASGLRRYDLQAEHKRDVKSDAPDRDVSSMSSGRSVQADLVASVLRPLMSAVEAGNLDGDTAGSVVELVRDGTSSPAEVLAWLASL